MLPVKKLLYVNFFLVYIRFLIGFIGCEVSRANFLSFTYHFNCVFSFSH